MPNRCVQMTTTTLLSRTISLSHAKGPRGPKIMMDDGQMREDGTVPHVLQVFMPPWNAEYVR